MSELWLVLFLFLSSIVMVVMSIYALKIRKQIIKGLDEAAVKLADKFVGTNSGGLPPEKQHNHPVAKGLAQGVGAGVGYRLAGGGQSNDKDIDKDDASGTEHDAQASEDANGPENSESNSSDRHISSRDANGNGMSTTDSASFDGTGEESREDENNGRQLMAAESLDTGTSHRRSSGSSSRTSANTTNSANVHNAVVAEADKSAVADTVIAKGLAGEIKPASTEKARIRATDRAVALEQRANMEKNPEKAKQLHAAAGQAYDKGGHHNNATAMYKTAKSEGAKANANAEASPDVGKQDVTSDVRGKQSGKTVRKDAKPADTANRTGKKPNDVHRQTSQTRREINDETVNIAEETKQRTRTSSKNAKATANKSTKAGKKLGDTHRQISQTRREINDETVNVARETRQRTRTASNNVKSSANKVSNTGKKLNDVHRQTSQTRREINDETVNVVRETRQRVHNTKTAKAETKAMKKILKSKNDDEFFDS